MVYAKIESSIISAYALPRGASAVCPNKLVLGKRRCLSVYK